MWNEFRTDEEGGIVAGVSVVATPSGEPLHVYIARPQGPGPYPAVVLIHHAPGWDEFYREFARRFAAHGFLAVCPNLFEQFGHGTPDDVAARARGEGGVSDDHVVAIAAGALREIKAQPISNGKVGVIGSCSGGRHALLVACRVPEFDAVVDLWGGNVTSPPAQLTPQQPVAVADLLPNLRAPVLGLFGNEDQNPSPAQVNQIEAILQQNGKTYLFQRYDGAGHGFFYYHAPSYRPEQAMDGWDKVEAFFHQYLG